MKCWAVYFLHSLTVHCEHISLVGWGQAPDQHCACSFQQFQITLISHHRAGNQNFTGDPGIQIQSSIPFTLKKAGSLRFGFDMSHFKWYLAYCLALWPSFPFQNFLLLLKHLYSIYFVDNTLNKLQENISILQCIC